MSAEALERQALVKLADLSPSPLLVCADDGEIVYVNFAVRDRTGWQQKHIPDWAAWTERVYGEKEEGAGEVERIHEHGAPFRDGERRINTRGGQKLTWEMWATPLGVLSDGRRLHAVYGLDVTDRKELEDHLRERAFHDRLTGLYNRRHQAEQTEAAVATARKYGQPLSLCLADIDGFCDVNEVHGNYAGDRVLKGFAEILRTHLRGADMPAKAGGVVGRMGGDEFCVLFPFTGGDHALKALEKVREALAATEFEGSAGATFNVSAAFGLVEWESGMRMEDLFAGADRALANAKRNGGNRIETVTREEIH